MSRKFDYDAIIDDQVEDLRDRMRLLQGDRKCNVDLLESTKSSNRELIKELRNENKELRKQLSQLQNGEGVGSSEDENEIVLELTNQISKYRKQYDDLRHKLEQENSDLDKLKDTVKDLELESKRPNLEDSPQTRKIRMLENRLDKAMIKYNEAQSIRKTYEQIVKRLKEERIGFDNHLAAIERSLGAKNHDYDELILLSTDANHARDLAVQELEHLRMVFEENKLQREKELKEKSQIMKVKVEMNTRIEKREREKQEVIARESGDLGSDEEEALIKSLAVNKLQQGKYVEEKKEHRSKIDIFENAFRKIKEATGVSDVNEVIQKIVSQESTTENLIALTKENQSKVEILQELRTQLKAKVEEMKYSGSGSSHRRKMVDDHEEKISVAATRLERLHLKYERLAKILISVKAGIDHLADKIATVRDERTPVHLANDTIIDILYHCENTLCKLLHQCHPVQNAAASVEGTTLSSFKVSHGASIENSFSDTDLMNTRPYNQRIPLSHIGGITTLDDGDTHDEDNIVDTNDDTLSRDKVKKASTQILIAQDKKKKKQPKRINEQDEPSEDYLSTEKNKLKLSPKKRG